MTFANNLFVQYLGVEQGAATTVWAAVAKESQDLGGRYLENVGEAGPAERQGAPYGTGYAVAAYNLEDERKLWQVSEISCCN